MENSIFALVRQVNQSMLLMISVMNLALQHNTMILISWPVTIVKHSQNLALKLSVEFLY